MNFDKRTKLWVIDDKRGQNKPRHSNPHSQAVATPNAGGLTAKHSSIKEHQQSAHRQSQMADNKEPSEAHHSQATTPAAGGGQAANGRKMASTGPGPGQHGGTQVTQSALSNEQNKYIQLMILLAADEIESCKYNAKNIYDHHLAALENAYKSNKDKGEKKITNLPDIYNVVNVGLLRVKCMLIESMEEDIKQEAARVLATCQQTLEEKISNEVREIKKQMLQKQKLRMEQYNHDGQKEETTSKNTANERSKNKRNLDFNDFRWMLSAMGLIASFYNCLGSQLQCEQVYVSYVRVIEEFYERESVEAGNAYFMIGVYYFEQEQLQKSLACFIKALYIRKKELGAMSLGAADCHYNIGVIYKKLGIGPRAILHYQQTLEIRRSQIGTLSHPVSDILEQIGKYYIESGELKDAYASLHECYMIRKKLLRNSNSPTKSAPAHAKEAEADMPSDSLEITRVSILLLYLHQKIENELNEKKMVVSGDRTQGQGGLKLLEVSYDIKNIFEAEISKQKGGAALPHVKDSEKAESAAASSNQPQQNHHYAADDFLKGLLGEENWQRTTEMEPPSDNGRRQQGPDDAAVAVRQGDKEKQQEVNSGPSAENVNLAVQNFEKYGKQYFKKKFQDQLMDQFKEVESKPKDHFPRQQKEDGSDSDSEDLVSQSLDGMIATGLNTYKNAMKTRVVDGTFTHLVAFIMSLTPEQLQRLQQDQISFESNSFLYVSQDFIRNEISRDVIQLNLFENSKIWKVAKGDYLTNCDLPISVGNLKVHDRALSKTELIKQREKDDKFIAKIKQVPQFIETLLPAQQRILQQVAKRGIALKYFFISIHENQLTDFEQVHRNLQKDVERRQILVELSQNFPNKLMINRKKYDSLDTVFTYKNDILQTIHQIKEVDVFFYLTELPDEFTNNFGPDQDIRYAQIIVLAHKAHRLLQEKEQRLKTESPHHTVDESLLENGLSELEDREYQGLLDHLKMTMIQFINGLDLHEVYQFVNLFPFLVDQNELQKIIEREKEEALAYEAQPHFQVQDKIELSDGDEPVGRQVRTDSSGREGSAVSHQSLGSAGRLAHIIEMRSLNQIQLQSQGSSSSQEQVDLQENDRKRRKHHSKKRSGRKGKRATPQKMRPEYPRPSLSSAAAGVRAFNRPSILFADPNKYFNNALHKKNINQVPQPRMSAADMLTMQSHSGTRRKRSKAKGSQRTSSSRTPSRSRKSDHQSPGPRPRQGSRDGQNRDLHIIDSLQRQYTGGSAHGQTQLDPIQEHTNHYDHQVVESGVHTSHALLTGYDQSQRRGTEDGRNTSMIGYGTLGGAGTPIMSFMAGGQSGNSLAVGGFDPQGAGPFMNIMDASIEKKQRMHADDGDISVEDQSLAEQILKL